MMLAQFLVPMLGTLLLVMSVRRTSQLRALLMTKQRAFFVTVGFLAIILIALDVSPIILGCLIGVLAASLRVLEMFLRSFAQDFSLEEALSVLDEVILGMKGGSSLKISLKEAARSSRSSKMSRLLHGTLERLEHGSDFSLSQPVARRFLNEIRRIHIDGVGTITAMEFVRSQLKKQVHFRRRSGQITLQTRLQALISACLYLPLFVFQILTGNLLEMRTILSLFLFLSAQIWIFQISRSFRWKT